MDRAMLKTYIFLFTMLLLLSPFLFPTGNHSFYLFVKNKAYALSYTCESSPTLKVLHNKPATVIFTMDDGWLTQYTEAYYILKENGFKGSMAVVPSLVNTKGYVATWQLMDLYKNGWDLFNHTYHHLSLPKLSKKEQRNELNRAKEWLDRHCFSRASDIVAYPYGAYSEDTLEVLREEGYRAGRTLHEGVETTVPINQYEVKTISLLPNLKFEWIKKWIDDAIKNKQTLIFVNHRFSTNVDSSMMDFDPKFYRQVVEYIRSKQDQILVTTYSEWITQGR